jgi:hypothetical protein
MVAAYANIPASMLQNIAVDYSITIVPPAPSNANGVDAESIWGVPITDPTLSVAQNGWVWQYNYATQSYVLAQIPAASVQAYQTIVGLPQRSSMQFTGAGVSQADVAGVSTITIPGTAVLVADLAVTLTNGESNFAVNLAAAGSSFTATGPTATYSIGGIVGTANAQYRGILRANQTCWIRRLSASASSGNRIETPTGADMQLVAPSSGGFITVQFDWKPWADSNRGGWVYAGW